MRNPPEILIVDDEKDFQEVLATKFKASGFAIETASDGAAGVERAKERLPDLIMMDVKMPTLDGVAALLKLKEEPTTRAIKVMLMTAYGDPQPEVYKNDQRFAKDLGAVEYVLKGQDLDEIVAKVKSFLAT